MEKKLEKKMFLGVLIAKIVINHNERCTLTLL